MAGLAHLYGQPTYLVAVLRVVVNAPIALLGQRRAVKWAVARAIGPIKIAHHRGRRRRDRQTGDAMPLWASGIDFP